MAGPIKIEDGMDDPLQNTEWLQEELARVRAELEDANAQVEQAQHRATIAEKFELRAREILYASSKEQAFASEWRVVSDKAWEGDRPVWLLIPGGLEDVSDSVIRDGYIVQYRITSANFVFRYTDAIRWQTALVPRVFS